MTDITRNELSERLGDPSLVVLDVRRVEEFSGQVTAPCDPRPGHLPGARHVALDLLLAARDPVAVRELVGCPPGTEVIAYCHSGSRSGLAVQVLAAAGYDARNYVGSWHEWSRDPALPVELGPDSH